MQTRWGTTWTAERKERDMATPDQCPVCNMPVDPQTAPAADYQGQDYYFCSEGCNERFLLDPSRYVGV